MEIINQTFSGNIFLDSIHFFFSTGSMLYRPPTDTYAETSDNFELRKLDGDFLAQQQSYDGLPSGREPVVVTGDFLLCHCAMSKLSPLTAAMPPFGNSKMLANTAREMKLVQLFTIHIMKGDEAWSLLNGSIVSILLCAASTPVQSSSDMPNNDRIFAVFSIFTSVLLLWMIKKKNKVHIRTSTCNLLRTAIFVLCATCEYFTVAALQEVHLRQSAFEIQHFAHSNR